MTDLDLLALDAAAQAGLVRSGGVTARQLIELTLERIEHLNPAINAFRRVHADAALAEADAIDASAPSKQRPLLGVPIAVKDDTDVAGEITAWGSAALRQAAAADAEVVARLRAAGAIIVGKTNVPELTLWPWTASARCGTTRNPWNLDRTPGGSSGGSAAAVCAGMSALALGSDGGGSIRYPAGLTALVGLEPQRDRIPIGSEHGSGWYGLVALGPLCRSVRDAALFLDITSSPPLPAPPARCLPPTPRPGASRTRRRRHAHRGPTRRSPRRRDNDPSTRRPTRSTSTIPPMASSQRQPRVAASHEPIRRPLPPRPSPSGHGEEFEVNWPHLLVLGIEVVDPQVDADRTGLLEAHHRWLLVSIGCARSRLVLVPGGRTRPVASAVLRRCGKASPRRARRAA
jgi:hypothetical protein